MNAQLKIESRAISRPRYDNTRLASQEAWIDANSASLRAWWGQCGQGVGPLTEADYRGFCRSQHEIQIYLRRQGAQKAKLRGEL